MTSLHVKFEDYSFLNLIIKFSIFFLLATVVSII